MSGVHGGCGPGAPDTCAVCADEGIEMTLVSVDRARDSAVAEVAGERQEIALDLLAEAAVGDRVVVHLGFAIGRIEGSA